MPYIFIAKTASLPFEGAARPIIDSRSRMNWAAKLALAQYRGQTIEQVREEWKSAEFNEVLALGYMEDQRINYHDDGEYGLGPAIATLSLGATGAMRIRMKAKHYNGVSKSMILTPDPPILGCQKYAERRAMQPVLDDLKFRDKNAYKIQAKAVPRELGLSDRPTSPDVLNMTVRHGDIVIMHGSDLQRYYERSVDHKGKLRFALTCHYIDPDSLKPHERPNDEIAPDPGVYDGTKLPLPLTSRSFL